MKRFEITSYMLHLIAMALMLCDHLWGTIVPGNEWLTCIGRLSMPIFAFLIVEGYFHTSNLRRYVQRLLVFALISEIPFNLMTGSRLFYPIHQNILWSFLISLGLIHLNEKAKATHQRFRILVVAVLSILFGSLIGLVTMVDYYHAGVLTVLIFYFFRGKSLWHRLGQLIGIWYVHAELLGGLGYELMLFGHLFFLKQQSLAVLALIPIWFYRGKQGTYNKVLKAVYYWFYPVHLLILGILKMM